MATKKQDESAPKEKASEVELEPAGQDDNPAGSVGVHVDAETGRVVSEEEAKKITAERNKRLNEG